MINLIEGQINLGENKISISSRYEDLDALAKEGAIEKRKESNEEGYYFYMEAIADDLKFGVFISLRRKIVDYILLRWLDGPCTGKGWDDVSEKALKEEYRRLLKFVEDTSGNPPHSKKDRHRTWRMNWGQVDVSYEPRDFVVAIFMNPRKVA